LTLTCSCSDKSGSETRRQAASDFNKALMEQFEAQITQIVSQYIGAYLQVSKKFGFLVFRGRTC
jgi:hypothetical protein